MYIKKVEIKNIRSISEFTMEFPGGKEAGWHVLIGDNGAGKSTILKAMAVGLLGPSDALRINPDWESWVKKGTDKAQISLAYLREDKEDLPDIMRNKSEANIELTITPDSLQKSFKFDKWKASWNPSEQISHPGKRFTCAFGPFRRFTGGETMEEKEKITPLTPYTTLFRPEIALTSTLAWIKDQHLRSLEKNGASGNVIEGIKRLITSGDLLPNQLVVDKITADGVFFKDVNNTILHINDLSDGIKSVLSLTLELVRLMLDKYSVEEVFGTFSTSNSIPVAGIVLIDEIDAHLHPSWQTRIGQWFIQYFPNLQFIVTTHSPLICRACENGSIWRLAAPGSHQKSGKVTGEDKDNLVYGDVLDAYETDVFGANITRGEEGREKQEEYRSLVYKENYGLKMNAEEKKQLKHLKSIFHTDVAVEE